MIGDDVLQKLMSSQRVESTLSNSLLEQTDSQFDISIIVPTRNEAGNIRLLLSRIEQAIGQLQAEVIFVDDSTDDTPDVIKDLHEKFSLRVVLIVRSFEDRGNGLGGAVAEGLRVARAPWVCVMDGDLQHPPELIPQLLESTEKAKVDIVIASRLALGGDASSLGSKRNLISRVFAMTTRTTFPIRLKNVTDPLSGFFLVRRAAVDLHRLRPNGFKILLEILIRCPELKIKEIPFQFGYRQSGESKASLREMIRLFRLLFRLRLATNPGLVRFLAVGVSGLVVNNLALAAFTELAGLHYLLSAGVATQVSTLWNFGLTESWVFGQRQTKHTFLRRLASFLLINNLMLLLRGPLLSLMVERLGLHYLLSNLISLFALTLIRYVVADQWIWGNGSVKEIPEGQSRRRRMTRFKRNNIPTSQPEPFIFSYDIHGILRVASMLQLPELEYFRVDHLLKEPDIRLRLERRRKERRRGERGGTQRRSNNDIHYSESLGRLGFQVTISYNNCVEIAVSPILQLSLHVLYTNVIEPILRWAFVRKGYALVHAACIASYGQAILVTAKTDTGKTSTILRAVENLGWSFLSDDMTIVSRDGKAVSYPKPLTISNHTLSAVNGNSSLRIRERLALQIQSRLHSRSGRRIGMRLSETVLPTATMNVIVQMLIPPPKYMVDRLIRQAKYANSAMLSGAVIIERGPEYEETLHHNQAVEIFLQNAEDAYGFPPYPLLATSLSCWKGEDLHPQEQAIVDEALSRISTVRLRDPKFNWWKRLPAILANSFLSRPFVSTHE